MTRPKKQFIDPEAPHGRDDEGVPLAPYGYLKNGNPRKSRRGAQAGQKGNGGPQKDPVQPSKTTLNATDRKRREALLGLLEGYVTLPLIGLGMSPWAEKRLGSQQCMALAGDGLILATYAEPLADALIVAGQDKPGLLRWLDTLEEKAPWLMLANVGVQMIKALVGNHVNPNPAMAQAAVSMAQIKAMQYAAAVQKQAEDMGIPTSVFVPEDEDQAA